MPLTAKGNNIIVKKTGNKLVITVDLSKDIGPSKTGKTVVIASTKGNVDIEGMEGTKMGINIYRYPEQE